MDIEVRRNVYVNNEVSPVSETQGIVLADVEVVVLGSDCVDVEIAINCVEEISAIVEGNSGSCVVNNSVINYLNVSNMLNSGSVEITCTSLIQNDLSCRVIGCRADVSSKATPNEGGWYDDLSTKDTWGKSTVSSKVNGTDNRGDSDVDDSSLNENMRWVGGSVICDKEDGYAACDSEGYRIEVNSANVGRSGVEPDSSREYTSWMQIMNT